MNILLVAYYFPPIISGGSERPRAMAKYLPAFGLPVRVLTHTYGPSECRDSAVVRVHDPGHNRNRRGPHLAVWLATRLGVEALNRMGIQASVFYFWKRTVLATAAAICQSQRPDLIIATYPPVECLEIGRHFSMTYGIPLLADFRDGLLFEPIEAKSLSRFAGLRRRYQLLEKRILDESAAVVTVSPPLSDYFSRQYGRPDVVTIPNGYDEEEFEFLPPTPYEFDPDHFHIVHTGGFARSDPGCDIAPFIAALERLLAGDGRLRHRIRLHLAGALTRRERRLLRRLSATGIVIPYGVCDRPRALSLQVKADLLLLATSTQRSSIATSKIFEYLRAARPILALTGGTYAAQLVQETGSGWVVDPADEAAIASLLGRICGDPAFYAAVRPDTASLTLIESYSRLNQMRRLSDIIKRLPRP